MRLLRSVMRILTVLCAVWLAVLANRHDGGAVPAGESCCRPESTVVAPCPEKHYEAILTDATQLYRICSSRPQRLIPTHGSKTERTLSSYAAIVRRHIVKPFHLLYDGRRRLETAPFRALASRYYYVIALRHILC